MGWADLTKREASTGIRPGDPILLALGYRVDELFSLYTRSIPARGFTRETKRSYITGDCLFFTFLWLRGKAWTQAVESDVDHGLGSAALVIISALHQRPTRPSLSSSARPRSPRASA